MKVILEFNNLRDSSDLSKHLQSMADAAKKSQGFLFCSRGEGDEGIRLIHSLTAHELAVMIESIEDEHPEIKIIRMMNAMGKQFRR